MINRIYYLLFIIFLSLSQVYNMSYVRRSAAQVIGRMLGVRFSVLPKQRSLSICTEEQNILKDPETYFHSIGWDISKLESILTYGILSANAAKQNANVELIRSYFWGYNGEKFISLSKSPACYKTNKIRSFNIFSEEGISFVLKDVDVRPMSPWSNSGFSDEVWARYKIPQEKIIGIMIPEHILVTKLSNIDFLDLGCVDGFHIRAKKLYKYVSVMTGYKNVYLWSLIKKKVSNKKASVGRRKKISNFVEQAYETYFGREVTMGDVLRLIIPQKIDIYNNQGKRITL